MTDDTFRCPLQSDSTADLLIDAARSPLLQCHIETCPDCRQFLESQQKIWSALDAWKPGPVAPGFDAELLERIEIVHKPRWFANFHWKPALPAFALLALWIVIAPTPSDIPPPSEAIQAEQVERALEDLDMLQQLPLNVK